MSARFIKQNFPKFLMQKAYNPLVCAEGGSVVFLAQQHEKSK